MMMMMRNDKLELVNTMLLFFSHINGCSYISLSAIKAFTSNAFPCSIQSTREKILRII